MVLLDDVDEERFIPFPRQTAPIPAVEASGYRSLKKRQPLPDDYYGYTHPARNHSPAVAAAAAPSCVRHAPRALATKRSGKYDPYANYIQPPPPKDQVLARREKRAAERERARQEVAAAQRRPRSVTPTLTARARSARSVSPSPSTHKRGPAAAWSYSQKPPDSVFSRPPAGSAQVRSSSVASSKRKGDGHPDAAQRSKTPPVIRRKQPKAWSYSNKVPGIFEYVPALKAEERPTFEKNLRNSGGKPHSNSGGAWNYANTTRGVFHYETCCT
eukprot:Rhum_TRINITY_DN9942_c0_g2::Rhum_TRINITY_DN9942_c0_g2_i1::g.35917::m.35917